MTTLCLCDLSEPKVIDLRANRVMREEVRAYAEKLGLAEVQIEACIDRARIMHSVDEGRKCADRIHDKMRAIRTRFGTRPDPKDAA